MKFEEKMKKQLHFVIICHEIHSSGLSALRV